MLVWYGRGMAIFIALLRAINVGSGRGVKMADLARVVGEAGGEQVSTYIQSGNVVFTHESGSPPELEAELEDGSQRLPASTSLSSSARRASGTTW